NGDKNKNLQLRVDDDDELHGSLEFLLGEGLQSWRLRRMDCQGRQFITCDPTSPVAVHKTGHDLVRLTEPGVHYFITSQSGYCEAGLKLRVMVKPEPKAVTYPNFPKKVDLSAMERLNNWLKNFKHQPHH
ncbi:hypothetical protein HID58_035857, partial [Brassica napus]